MILGWLVAAPGGSAAPSISVEPQAEEMVRFAARELQRYVYVCSGDWLSIAERGGGAAAPSGFALHVDAASGSTRLAPGNYHVAVSHANGTPQINIRGGDAQGVLYGVYRYVERLGVRFYLHGDVIPDQQVPWAVPDWEELGRPHFSVRGLLPFHDFSEGPDWWNRDDYLAAFAQMAKLRMNFVGLHTYPDSQVGPEPTVWIGLPEDLTAEGRVEFAYPASYHTTGRSGRTWWGYDPVATSDFRGGAAKLFERDDFGAEVMRGASFAAQTPQDARQVFEQTAGLFASAFAAAGDLGILTCVGTETPLTLPEPLKQRLRDQGRDPASFELTQEVYRAMFTRIAQRYPVDYYWLWTPENWTWEGNHPEHFEATARDIRAALGALEELGNPMTLATCGWVLGPQHDRAALDRLLPPGSPMSAINSSVGHTPIERQFANLSDRPRWAIPWLENDGTITAPQLWAGRMRYDAFDARRLGCTGLIGIHWRTKVLAPAIAALAAAAWDQSWLPPGFDATPLGPLTASGATGGRAVTVRAATAKSSAPTALYQTNRIGMRAYDVLVPNGSYRVRLGFSEVEGRAAGERVFDVRLQSERVLEQLDPARAAHGAGFVHTIDAVKVTDAHLLLEFVPHQGEPAIAFIEIDGTTDVGQVAYSRRINCGGPQLGGHEADELPGETRPPIDRAMPVHDLYLDFATANFGAEVAPGIARILTAIEGVKLPTPNHWIDGPGDIRRNPEPWDQVAAKYAFVAEWEALRPQVQGAAARDRFDNWLNQFRAMRLVAQIGCLAGALDEEMKALQQLAAAAAKQQVRERALPLRVELAQRWDELLRTTQAAVSTVSELGTLANLEQRSRVHQQILSKHDAALADLLGQRLPPETEPSHVYRGPARIIVPTVLTATNDQEPLVLKILLLSENTPGPAVLRWRRLGEDSYHQIPLRHVGRHVYRADLPPLSPPLPGIEYHVEATLDGATHRWPISERELNQTVVLGPGHGG